MTSKVKRQLIYLILFTPQPAGQRDRSYKHDKRKHTKPLKLKMEDGSEKEV